uniref:Uncharacterized protein n=1 Tax=Avena sativa TaxID=4498 RepID=A0ACD5WI30_AVESA
MTSPRRSSRRRGSPLLVPAPALEDDDLLHEILLRLPPQPPYLLRASLVCKRWRRLATDPRFLRRFRLYHGVPPLLGVFLNHDDFFSFRPTLDPPSRIPPERFALRLDDHRGWRLFNCRHGRVLLINMARRQFIVWNPISDDGCLVAVPPEFHGIHTGAVLRATDDHSSPFKVVLLGANEDGNQTLVRVYSSETTTWGVLVSISTELPCMEYKDSYISTPSTLVGNTLYWWTGIDWWIRHGILAFDLDTQCLAEIEKPSFSSRVKKSSSVKYDQSVQIIRTKDGALGFAALWCTDSNETCLEMWERGVNCHGVDTWVLSKSVTVKKILVGNYMRGARILRYVEDVRAILLRAGSSIFMFLYVLKKLMSSKWSCLPLPWYLKSSLKHKQLTRVQHTACYISPLFHNIGQISFAKTFYIDIIQGLVAAGNQLSSTYSISTEVSILRMHLLIVHYYSSGDDVLGLGGSENQACALSSSAATAGWGWGWAWAGVSAFLMETAWISAMCGASAVLTIRCRSSSRFPSNLSDTTSIS